MHTFTQVYDYLEQRGSRYGIPLKDMLTKTPSSILDDPEELLEFWKNKDISHIYPLETHPELANEPNNCFSEDIGENRASNQAGDIAIKSEIFDAYIDNEMDVIAIKTTMLME